MADKYIVDLNAAEQACLLSLIKKGKPSARKVARAHSLLRAAEGATDEGIAQALHLSVSTVHRTRQRLVEEGLTTALSECPRPGKMPALSGKQEAFLVALACSTPPEGHRRWTMQLLADRLVELRQVEATRMPRCDECSKKRPQAMAAQTLVHPQGEPEVCLAYGGCGVCQDSCRL